MVFMVLLVVVKVVAKPLLRPLRRKPRNIPSEPPKPPPGPPRSKTAWLVFLGTGRFLIGLNSQGLWPMRVRSWTHVRFSLYPYIPICNCPVLAICDVPIGHFPIRYLCNVIICYLLYHVMFNVFYSAHRCLGACPVVPGPPPWAPWGASRGGGPGPKY